MGPEKKRRSNVEFVIEEEEINGGGIERYEVSIGPPMVSGRKVKPTHTEDPKGPERAPREPTPSRGSGDKTTYVAGNPQQIYKIEDDLQRTRDRVEDIKHTVSVIESEVKDLRVEMDRISYLVRSLEGLKNTMKDMETTVSELSGLYDLISANINPFIDIPPLKKKRGIEPEEVEEVEEFKPVSEIFGDEEEWGPDLDSEGVVIKWALFLVERVGKEGLESVLDYYIDLGWIDEPLQDRIIGVARGMSFPPVHREGKKASWKMGADDHVESLGYIKRILE